jgi:hypothetical protein
LPHKAIKMSPIHHFMTNLIKYLTPIMTSRECFENIKEYLRFVRHTQISYHKMLNSIPN